MGGAAVKNVSKAALFFVSALFVFATLSCGGGGGGGGGGVAAASSSGPWGGKTTITIPFTKGTSRAGFSEGFLRLPWKSITFTVTQTANGVSEVVFEETIEAEKNITVEVLTGSKIEATAVIAVEGEREPRTATGGIERVEPGKNTLTLHVPYTYTLQYGAGGPIETGEYNSREGLNLPSYYNDGGGNTRIVTGYINNADPSGKPYLPGIHHDITGDIELKAEISPMNVYQDDGKYYIGCDPGTLPATITIPAKVGDKTIYGIGDGYFKERTDIQTVIIEDGIQSIGDNAFKSCSGLQSVTIPDSVTTIGEYAFQLTRITSLKLPSRLTTLGEYAFSACTALTGSLAIPSSVGTISAHAFEGAGGITEVVIEQNVQSIGSEAFVDCDSLRSITIPGSVTSIGQHAFSYCDILAEVRMPVCDASTMNGFGSIFASSNSLRDIYFTTPVPCFVDSTAILGIMDEITIHVPEAGRAYESDWNSYFYGYKEIVYY